MQWQNVLRCELYSNGAGFNGTIQQISCTMNVEHGDRLLLITLRLTYVFEYYILLNMNN